MTKSVYLAEAQDEAVAAHDVELLLEHIKRLGIVPVETSGSWAHMGAVIANASLQAGIGYKSVVLPRVFALKEAWPDADTTSGVARRLLEGTLPLVLSWKGRKKLAVFEALTAAFLEIEIETVDDLHSAFKNPETSRVLTDRLNSIKGVKSKTVDYLAILVGIKDRVAIDSQLRAFAAAAGLETVDYARLAVAYAAASAVIGCTPAALDSAVWKHMSGS